MRIYKAYIGIDNGTTGSIGIISEKIIDFIPTPIKRELYYTKEKKNISVLDYVKFREILNYVIKENSITPYQIYVAMERPMVNPTRFSSLASSILCWHDEKREVEEFGCPYIFLDSKQWQRTILPKGTIGTDELKRVSREVAIRLYPQLKNNFVVHKDGDGMLIAEYIRKQDV